MAIFPSVLKTVFNFAPFHKPCKGLRKSILLGSLSNLIRPYYESVKLLRLQESREAFLKVIKVHLSGTRRLPSIVSLSGCGKQSLWSYSWPQFLSIKKLYKKIIFPIFQSSDYFKTLFSVQFNLTFCFIFWLCFKSSCQPP